MQNFKHKTYSPLSFLEKLLCLEWIIVLLHKMFRVALPNFLSHSTVDYYSPRTWPRNCTSAEIKELLKDHLINPTSPPNYESLKQLLDLEDFVNIEILVQQYVNKPPPREMSVPQYLHCHLSKSCDDAAMPLQQRTRQLDVLANLGATNNACNNVAFCHSPRGSGKTQFVKCFVSTRHVAAAKHGRVIVRCCGNAAHSPQAPWIKKIMEDCKGCDPNKLRDEAPSPRGVTAFLLSCLVRVLTLCKRSPSSEKSMKASPVAQGLCEMIRAHVELETGNPQDVSKYSTPQKAYETWKRETARFFKISPRTQGVERD
ncbi:Bodo-specific multi-copy gene family, putative [Bodo saltans]|uniref:Bodo-specific multi-copy gene family, putative n=1 Tax=Bodo saltans TaxID=75058 RepID=A0A0S4JVF8_BODSA|nr:Bodo-specific multi-copy gene family, putative [Bodo saltans]|eukprot:CUG92562.1 Bodo-specific multi-copy gene family, putative [Bodo saltans]